MCTFNVCEHVCSRVCMYVHACACGIQRSTSVRCCSSDAVSIAFETESHCPAAHQVDSAGWSSNPRDPFVCLPSMVLQADTILAAFL